MQILCDLSGRFGTARDQGKRNTCTAFATSDAHAFSIGPYTPLSCEYAYFHASARQGSSDPHDGVSLSVMTETIECDGQPSESGWAYLDALPSDLSLWVPPKDVGHIFKSPGQHHNLTVEAIIDCLNSGIPAVLGMQISTAFHMPSNDDVIDETVGDIDAGSHAVLVIGHGTKNGERLMLIRNSWGPLWKTNGMAWLTESYLTSRIMALAHIA